MKIISLITEILVILQFLDIDADRPKCTVIIIKNGDKPSTLTYKNKRNRGEEYWDEVKGMITTKGMKQLYDVGKSMRAKYKHLLVDVYDPFQITLKSTDAESAVMSSQAFLAGLYPVNKTLEFDPEIAWRPSPVHTIPKEKNDVVYTLQNCPKHKRMLEEIYNTTKVIKLMSDYEHVKWIVQNNTGESIEPFVFSGLNYIYTVLKTEEMQNKTHPVWARQIFPYPLSKIYKETFELDIITHELTRLAVGSTLLKVLEDLYVMNKNKKSQKVIVHSTHDAIIPYLLHVLQLKYDELPLFGAYLQFDLVDGMHSDRKEITGIQITYNGEPLRVPDCGHFCPFLHFRRRHNDLYVYDIKDSCHIEPDWIYSGYLPFPERKPVKPFKN